MVHDGCPSRTLWVAYDLRDPDQWEGARSDREAWGRGFSDVHALDADHILIAFHPGGAGGESQAAA
jgi:hypothetical protein